MRLLPSIAGDAQNGKHQGLEIGHWHEGILWVLMGKLHRIERLSAVYRNATITHQASVAFYSSIAYASMGSNACRLGSAASIAMHATLTSAIAAPLG